MNNKKIAFAAILFIAIFLISCLALAAAGHIPFIGRALSLIIAVIAIIFVLVFFIIISKKKK